MEEKKVDEGLSGSELLSEDIECQSQIRTAVEAMLANAEQIAAGTAKYNTYEDVFGLED